MNPSKVNFLKCPIDKFWQISLVLRKSSQKAFDRLIFDTRRRTVFSRSMLYFAFIWIIPLQFLFITKRLFYILMANISKLRWATVFNANSLKPSKIKWPIFPLLIIDITFKNEIDFNKHFRKERKEWLESLNGQEN